MNSREKSQKDTEIRRNELINKITAISQQAEFDKGAYQLGMWGQRRLEYLKNEKTDTYYALLTNGLWEHLIETDKAADAAEDRLIDEMSVIEGITEELKAKNQLEWVARMNNLKNRVREIIYNEFIYV